MITYLHTNLFYTYPRTWYPHDEVRYSQIERVDSKNDNNNNMGDILNDFGSDGCLNGN
jgi:hypothetical protein